MRNTPFRIKKIGRYVNKDDNIKILDVGCGSKSPSITKKYFPRCHYTGIDRVESYNNNLGDLYKMDRFIQMDISEFKFDCIDNSFYDIIILSHVIEHIFKGNELIDALLNKLKKGGIIYIEFPSEKSIEFPSMYDTLNFFDDETHCRIYTKKEICNTLMYNKCKILEVSTRRDPVNIIMIPIKIIYNILTKRKLAGGIFWDLFGFAEFVVATKK